jgi:outer membrane protein assembly factor BamB
VIRQSRIASRTTPPLIGAIGALLAVLGGCNNDQGPATLPPSAVVQITGPCFVKKWQTQLRMTPGESVRDIYLVGDTLHIETDQNFDHCLNAASGDLQFFNQVATPEILTRDGPALVTDGFVIARGSALYLYNRDGRLQRGIDLGFTVTNQPVSVSPGKSLVIVGLDESGGRIAEVDVSRDIDPIAWEIMTNGLVEGAAAVSVGGIYAGSEDGGVRAFTDDRSLVWPLLPGSCFKAGGQIVSAVRADHPDLKLSEPHSVYFGATDGVLYCVNCDNGKLRWRYFAGTPLETAPEVTLSTVYQYVPGKGLVAIDRAHKMTLPDGTAAGDDPFPPARWIARYGKRFLAEDDQYSYVQSTSNTLMALDKQTGAVAFQSHVRGLRFAAVNLKTSMIYAVTRGGDVVAIQPVLQSGSFGEVVMAR